MYAQISFEVLIMMAIALSLSVVSLIWMRHIQSFTDISISALKNYSCASASYASELARMCTNCIIGVPEC